jgi:RNA polymerase sigma factor (sigma-70 family)
MTPAATAKSDAPPGDPVRAALEDPNVRVDLARHACATIGRWPREARADTREALVEVALQETYTKALQARHSFDETKGTVSAWLHGVLNNALRELSRRDGRHIGHPPIDSDGWEKVEAALAGPVDEVAARHDVAVLLSQLPDADSTILRWRYLEDLPSEEIANRLGISVGNARVRLSRALSAARTVAGATAREEGP